MSSKKIAAVVVVATCVVAGVAIAQTGTLFVEGDNVGIGTPTPSQPLHIITTGAPSNTVLQIENNGPARFRIVNTSTGETWNVGHQSPSGTGLVYSDVGDAVTEMLLDVDGNLTIAGQLTTAGGTYPDYVFEDDYQLLPLDELQAFIDQNGHLPNVPNASDVAAHGGVNMSELQLALLEKVEELTLYTLEQQEQLQAAAQREAELVRRLESLESRLGGSPR